MVGYFLSHGPFGSVQVGMESGSTWVSRCYKSASHRQELLLWYSVKPDGTFVTEMHVPVSTTDHVILRTSGSDWANLVGTAPCPALCRKSPVLVNGSLSVWMAPWYRIE